MTSLTGSPPTRLFYRLLMAALITGALVFGPIGAAPATAATRTPAVPTGLPSQIEALTSYVPANSCSTTLRAGTAKLGKLLTSTYPGTTYGAGRTCGALPNSEHHDGRAIDWMNNVRVPQQAAQATALVNWLFAADRQGNPYANARRLGVMYLIWNNKIWSAYSADQGWRDYSTCASHPEPGWDNTCHRNHMHISLSWSGATGQTSFWTKRAIAPDYGRCRPADLNWAYSYQVPNPTLCARYSTVRAPANSSPLMKTLTNYSGRYLFSGHTGPAVSAVQQAVRTTVDGSYGPATKTAVQNWQRARGLYVTGTINHDTWRALLKANTPKGGSLSWGGRAEQDPAALEAMRNPDPDR